jgi:RecA/RadA recombinase
MGRPRKETQEEKQDSSISELSSLVEEVENSVDEDFEEENTVFELTSFGSDVFDCIAGGGAPFGRMINLIGDNSVGKSLISTEIVAQARKKYGKNLVWQYDDAEAGYSFDSKVIWGFNVIDDSFVPSETIEDFALNVETFVSKLKPNQFGIYILDSFDSLTSVQEQGEFEDKMIAIQKGKEVKGTYAQGKAKGTNQFFRVMRNKIKTSQCLLVIVSQVRENLNAGMFGKKFYRAGGKSLDLYASQIFWLYKATEYKKKDTAVGVCIRAENTKNKVGKPYREGFFDILFDYGVDNIASNLKYLYDLKTDKGQDKEKINKTELEWEGKNYLFEELIHHIEDNGLERQLTRKVKKAWQEYEDSLSSNRKRRF